MISLLLVLALPAGAQAPIDLDGARAAAVSRSLEVEAATARAEAARGDATATLSGALPGVTAFAGGTTGAGRTASGFDRPVGLQVGVGVTGAWTVVAPTDWAAASAARRTLRGQEAMAAWARVEARRDATAAFADVLAAEEAVAAWERALEDAREGAEAVSQLVEAGLRPSADGARAAAEAASVEATLRAAEGARASACATLLGLVREVPAATCAVTPPAWEQALAAPADGAGEHPALVAARAAVSAAEATRTGALLARAPELEASGTWAAYAADGGALAPGWSAGLSVELPVVTGGAIQGDLTGDRARLAVARAELDAAARDLAVARVAAEARHAAALTELRAREAARDAADAAFTLVDERFAAGLVDLQAWLDARRDRDAAAVGVAEARRSALQALAEVEAARGVY